MAANIALTSNSAKSLPVWSRLTDELFKLSDGHSKVLAKFHWVNVKKPIVLLTHLAALTNNSCGVEDSGVFHAYQTEYLGCHAWTE